MDCACSDDDSASRVQIDAMSSRARDWVSEARADRIGPPTASRSNTLGAARCVDACAARRRVRDVRQIHALLCAKRAPLRTAGGTTAVFGTTLNGVRTHAARVGGLSE